VHRISLPWMLEVVSSVDALGSITVGSTPQQYQWFLFNAKNLSPPNSFSTFVTAVGPSGFYKPLRLLGVSFLKGCFGFFAPAGRRPRPRQKRIRAAPARITGASRRAGCPGSAASSKDPPATSVGRGLAPCWRPGYRVPRGTQGVTPGVTPAPEPPGGLF
jgi:hypothetical protein